MIVANTMPVAAEATLADQTNQGAAAATEYNKNSIKTRMPPGVGTPTVFLSFVVEKIEGRPTSSTIVGTTNQLE